MSKRIRKPSAHDAELVRQVHAFFEKMRNEANHLYSLPVEVLISKIIEDNLFVYAHLMKTSKEIRETIENYPGFYETFYRRVFTDRFLSLHLLPGNRRATDSLTRITRLVVENNARYIQGLHDPDGRGFTDIFCIPRRYHYTSVYIEMGWRDILDIRGGRDIDEWRPSVYTNYRMHGDNPIYIGPQPVIPLDEDAYAKKIYCHKADLLFSPNTFLAECRSGDPVMMRRMENLFRLSDSQFGVPHATYYTVRYHRLREIYMDMIVHAVQCRKLAFVRAIIEKTLAFYSESQRYVFENIEDMGDEETTTLNNLLTSIRASKYEQENILFMLRDDGEIAIERETFFTYVDYLAEKCIIGTEDIIAWIDTYVEDDKRPIELSVDELQRLEPIFGEKVVTFDLAPFRARLVTLARKEKKPTSKIHRHFHESLTPIGLIENLTAHTGITYEEYASALLAASVETAVRDIGKEIAHTRITSMKKILDNLVACVPDMRLASNEELRDFIIGPGVTEPKDKERILRGLIFKKLFHVAIAETESTLAYINEADFDMKPSDIEFLRRKRDYYYLQEPICFTCGITPNFTEDIKDGLSFCTHECQRLHYTQ